MLITPLQPRCPCHVPVPKILPDLNILEYHNSRSLRYSGPSKIFSIHCMLADGRAVVPGLPRQSQSSGLESLASNIESLLQTRAGLRKHVLVCGIRGLLPPPNPCSVGYRVKGKAGEA